MKTAAAMQHQAKNDTGYQRFLAMAGTYARKYQMFTGR
jgi:hypothetical protein